MKDDAGPTNGTSELMNENARLDTAAAARRGGQTEAGSERSAAKVGSSSVGGTRRERRRQARPLLRVIASARSRRP